MHENKVKLAAKKGVLTTAIISSVLASCNFNSKTDEAIKSAIEKSPYEVVDSTQLSQTKDTVSYEDVLNKIKSIKAISPKQDSLQRKVIDYMMNNATLDFIKDVLSNYEDLPGQNDPYDDIMGGYKKKKITINKLKKEIISLSSPEYFNTVNQISKKINGKIYYYHLRDINDVLSVVTPEVLLKLGFEKDNFVKMWDELIKDYINLNIIV